MLRGYKYLWRLDCNTDFVGAGGNGLKSARSGQDKRKKNSLSVSFSKIKLSPCNQFSCNFAKGLFPKGQNKLMKGGEKKESKS